MILPRTFTYGDKGKRMTMISLAIALLQFFASLGSATAVQHFDGVLGLVGEYGRSVTYGLLILYFLALASGAKFRLKSSPPPLAVIGYLMFLLLYGFKYLISGYGGEGLMVVAASVLYYFTFAFFSISPRQHYRPMLEDVFVGTGVACVLIIVSNTIALYTMGGMSGVQERLYGLSFNPNMLAYNIAITSFCVSVLVSRIVPVLVLRLCLLTCILALGAYLVLLSGSRGGMLLMALSIWWNMALQLKQRGRWFVTMLLALAVLIYVVAGTPGGRYLGIEERENTRSYVWAMQLEAFIEYPMIGEPWDEDKVRFRENTFLGAAAQLGLFGILSIALVFVGSVRSALRLYSRREWRLIGNRNIRLVLILMLAVFVASIFEAIMLGLVSPIIFLVLLINAGMQNELIEYRRWARVHRALAWG